MPPIKNKDDDEYPGLLLRKTRENYLEKVKEVSGNKKKGCPLTILIFITPGLVLAWGLSQLIS